MLVAERSYLSYAYEAKAEGEKRRSASLVFLAPEQYAYGIYGLAKHMLKFIILRVRAS